MEKNFPIGFFDSGVGGLSVYSLFKNKLPNENTIYYGDLKNLPYGNKTQTELIGFAKNILDFFKTKNVKAVVIACNTSSALAYEQIKNNYDFKIYPIIQSCAKVLAESNVKKIGVFATVGTVSSHAYSNEIQKHNRNISVTEIACPKWVSIVEKHENDISDIELQMKEMLSFKPDKIILGCTHYPYLMNYLTNFAPKELFIDPAEIFVNYIKEDLLKSDLLTDKTSIGNEEIFVSANPELFVENAQIFYKVNVLPTIHNSENIKICKIFA